MVTLFFVYISGLFIFMLVGAVRGWAKELLVSFSLILALFIIIVFQTYVPFVNGFLSQNGRIQFWIKSLLVIILVIFGYQTPNIRVLAGQREKLVRRQIPDLILGLFLGLINGYLVLGTLWYFLDRAGYPFPAISPPQAGQPGGDLAISLISWLPPTWIGIPSVFIVFALLAVFILVLFI